MQPKDLNTANDGGVQEQQDNPSSSTTKQPSQRGPGYTIIEDLLICKAFIAASEDPILGTSQKGKDFKKTMHERYKYLLREQAQMDQVNYSRASQSTRELLGDPSVVYVQRNPDSIYN